MNKNDIFPSKYLSAADLPDEGMTVTVRSVFVERMQDGAEKPIMAFVENIKDMIVNVTKWNTISELYGDESDDWAGKRINIKPGEVKFQGKMVACIDVSSRKPGATNPSKKNGAKGSPEAEKAIATAVKAGPDAEQDDDDDTPF